jgi:hypothetical protein
VIQEICDFTYPVYCSVQRRYHDKQRMNTTTWREKQECGEVSMIKMTNTVIYPRTMMIHLHNTSENTEKKLHAYTDLLPN